MAKTPEVKVKDKIKALCKTYGAYYAQPIGMGMASNGTPDMLVCHRGQFAGVEAKAGKGKPTKLQMVRLEEILAAGGASLVINENNLKLLEAWLIDPGQSHFNNLEDWR
jgi:hypothetical protein